MNNTQNTENNKLTVQHLRQTGFKVRVNHFRYGADEFGNIIMAPRRFLKLIYPKGGYTRVEIKTPDGQELIGVSKCHNVDNFNFATANQMAIGRALANYAYVPKTV